MAGSKRPRRRLIRGFGELESQVMDRLWSRGEPATVREILGEFSGSRALAYTTVMTVMDNLHRKGWLLRELDGRAYRYQPVYSRERYVAEVMREALSSSTDHSATLLRFSEQLTEDESEALRRALRRGAQRKP
jgi:predicted transcriptional regulator